MTTKRKRQAKLLRFVRKIHRYTGVALFLFFAIVGITGILLGWKKNSNGYLLPDTEKGQSTEMVTWLSMDSISTLAMAELARSYGGDFQAEIDRLDVRPSKGMVKVLFDKDNIGIQLDLTTGQVLNNGKRRADWLEDVHDGTIVDDLLGTKNVFKLFYTTIMGLALLIFTVTGFWLWYGPKKMRTS